MPGGTTEDPLNLLVFCVSRYLCSGFFFGLLLSANAYLHKEKSIYQAEDVFMQNKFRVIVPALLSIGLSGSFSALALQQDKGSQAFEHAKQKQKDTRQALMENERKSRNGQAGSQEQGQMEARNLSEEARQTAREDAEEEAALTRQWRKEKEKSESALKRAETDTVKQEQDNQKLQREYNKQRSWDVSEEARVARQANKGEQRAKTVAPPVSEPAAPSKVNNKSQDKTEDEK